MNKFDGRKELQECIKMLPHRPTNTEIVEKTGVSKGSISEIMNGKRTPTERFIIAFKKGFKLENKEALTQIHKPSQNDDLKDKMIAILETALKSSQAENERLNKLIDKLI